LEEIDLNRFNQANCFLIKKENDHMPDSSRSEQSKFKFHPSKKGDTPEKIRRMRAMLKDAEELEDEASNQGEHERDASIFLKKPAVKKDIIHADISFSEKVSTIIQRR
jgi:hypothetical protein